MGKLVTLELDEMEYEMVATLLGSLLKTAAPSIRTSGVRVLYQAQWTLGDEFRMKRLATRLRDARKSRPRRPHRRRLYRRYAAGRTIIVAPSKSSTLSRKEIAAPHEIFEMKGPTKPCAK
jgi:hypothetical protein